MEIRERLGRRRGAPRWVGVLTTLALSSVLTGAGALPSHPRQPTVRQYDLSVAVSVTSALECEGTACQKVAVTYDEARQQYRAQNNSPDQWVKVSASNLAAAASACLAPGTSEYLSLKSIVGAYTADYAEPRCGVPDNYGNPPSRE